MRIACESPTFGVDRAAAPGRPAGWRAVVAPVAIGLLAIAVGACASQPTRNPSLSQAHLRLGADYFGKRAPQAAKSELLRAIHYDDENQEAHYLLGVIFLTEGIYALNYGQQGRCLTGMAATEQSQAADEAFTLAGKYLLRSVALARRDERTDSEALNALANVELHFKRYAEAIRLCGEALDNVLFAGQHLALANRAWAEFEVGNLPRAARDLRQALFHRSAFCLGHFRLGRVYLAQQRWSEAIEELKQAAGDATCSIQEASFYLGQAYAKQGSLAQAREQFAQCVASDPKSCVSFECRRHARTL